MSCFIAIVAAVVVEPEPEPDAIINVTQDEAPLEDLLPWDHMLTTKEKRRKEKKKDGKNVMLIYLPLNCPNL